MPVIRVLSTLAVQGAFARLAPVFEAATGIEIDAEFAPTLALLDRLVKGHAADVLILTQQGLAGLAADGTVVAESSVDVARSYLGVAVRAGAVHPDITTANAFRSALLAARCVAYSRLGASGIFFAGLIAKMEIADEINARAIVIPSGLTAARLVTGEADIAVQQISELKLVDGVEIVGPFPQGMQETAVFSAGRIAASGSAQQADELLRFLTSAQAAPVLRESGLAPEIAKRRGTPE